VKILFSGGDPGGSIKVGFAAEGVQEDMGDLVQGGPFAGKHTGILVAFAGPGLVSWLD